MARAKRQTNDTTVLVPETSASLLKNHLNELETLLDNTNPADIEDEVQEEIADQYQHIGRRLRKMGIIL